MKKMLEPLKRLFSFIKSVLSERDGSGSASRVVKLLVAGGAIFCLVLVTWRRGELPSPDQLKALAAVIGAGSVPYAANKLSAILGKGKSTSEAGGEESEAKAEAG